jgi:hypothetical protein
MTRHLAAASCIQRQSSRAVWISDALLAETFHRFFHHKRHGSNVPGPLEAQRRATKRKNTSLAALSAGGISVDPAIVLGSSAHKAGWWGSHEHKPEKYHAQKGAQVRRDWFEASDSEIKSNTAPRLLPAWLFPPVPPENEAFQSHSGRETPQFRIRTSPSYKISKLEGCRNLQDIKTWVEERGHNLREDPKIGDLIAEHFMRKNVSIFSITDLAAYICDPAFHTPTTHRIRDLIRAIVTRHWKPFFWKQLCDSIFSAVELGLMGIDDIRCITNELLDARHLMPMNSKDNLHLIFGIIEALDRSPVLHVEDLGRDLLSKLFAASADIYDPDHCEKMSRRLLLWASQESFDLIVELVLRRLDHSVKSRPQTITNFLLGIKGDMLPAVLPRVTEEILQRSSRFLSANTVESYVNNVLHRWFHVLSLVGTLNHDVSITKNAWDFLQSQQCTLCSDQRIFAFAWTALILCYSLKVSESLSSRLQGLDRLEQMVEFLPKLSVEAAQLTVVESSNLPLPYKDVLLQNLGRLSLYTEPPLDPLERALAMRPGFSRSVFARGVTHGHLGRGDTILAMLDEAGYDFSVFKSLSRRMIYKNCDSFGIICQALESNTRIRHALRDELKPERVDAVPKQMTRLVEPNDTQEDSMQPDASTSPDSLHPDKLSRDSIVDLIHHLAISFATSPVATPRAALRRVYWCYRFYGYHGIPIDATITRALWHAGVTRYGAGGTATTLLLWLLDLIARVEGDGVCRQLLLSDRFRRARMSRFERQAEITAAEEKALDAMLKGYKSGFGLDDDDSVVTSTRLGSLHTAPPGLFSADKVAELLTGDEEVDSAIQAKVEFLASELPFEPLLASQPDGEADRANVRQWPLQASQRHLIRSIEGRDTIEAER